MTLTLDRANKRLTDDRGRLFLPGERVWAEAGPDDPAAGSAEPISPQAAVAWLQHDSGQPLKAPVGVVGPRSATAEQLNLAEALGAGLAGLGLTVLCGGRGGVMEAVCRGVAEAGGLSVGLLPDDSWTAANPFVAVPLATGSYGTTSEMALGLQFGRPVLALADAPDLPGVVRLASVDEALTALCEKLLDLT
jgi:hypothetical protein